jgi:prepilin-type N-terminal cleavage/methylation domain-containing protein
MRFPLGYGLRAKQRSAFTLIEMVLVILVILILAGLTIAVVGNVVDGDRVRGGARQVQNYLAGARDRAIYAASRIEDNSKIPPAIGVRFLPDKNYNDASGNVRAFGSMVFVQEVDPLPTFLTVSQGGGGEWHASQFSDPDGPGANPPVSFGISDGELPLRSAGELMKRGLLPGRLEPAGPAGIPTYYLPVYFDRDSSQEPYYIRFQQSDLARDGAMGPQPAPAYPAPLPAGFYWLGDGILSKPYFDATSTNYVKQPCKFRVLPSIMPSEEPRILPRGCVIDVAGSVVGGSNGGTTIQNQLRADGSFDVMFNSRGIVEGGVASQGQIHFVVVDGADLERGFSVRGPFANVNGTPYTDPTGSAARLDADSDGTPDERQGDEYIVSVRTQTGSIYVSDVNTALGGPPNFAPIGPNPPNNPFMRADAFKYAETGGEAR